ncbi:MAG: PepSY domain-containing protein, partial [Comamonas sp.]
PVVNALTTDRHLLNSLRAGDWVFAGFDLTMWGLAALLALMAVKVTRRLDPARAAARAAAIAPGVEEGSAA